MQLGSPQCGCMPYNACIHADNALMEDAGGKHSSVMEVMPLYSP